MAGQEKSRRIELPGALRRFVEGRFGDASRGREPGDDIHLGEPGFLNKLVRRRKLESVFLFVTSRCNSKCRTCFYSEELNKGEDMTFDEIRRISETAPAFDKLWLSGGEPFLREDLVDIITMFHERNGVKTINLPTNGLLGDKVVDAVDRLLGSCPDLNVHLNVSLDGLGEAHDRVRGVHGAFEKTMATLQRLAERYPSHPKLHRNVATVVTPDGYDSLVDLAFFLLDKEVCGTQFFETVRGNPRDPAVKAITRRDLEALHERLLPAYEVMADRLFSTIDPRARWFAKLYFMGFIRFVYGIQRDNVEGPCPWGMRCTAGETTIVVDHDGGIRGCELRPRIGDLHDLDFDLGAALASPAMRSEVAAVGGGYGANCWCTHSCWIMASMQFSPKTLAVRIPWSHLGPTLSGYVDAGREAIAAARADH